MKLSTGFILLILLLSSSAFAVQPESRASATAKSAGNQASVAASETGAYADERTRGQVNQVRAGQKSAVRDDARQPYRQLARLTDVQTAGYLNSRGELVEGGEMCIFNQASYTYSCR